MYFLVLLLSFLVLYPVSFVFVVFHGVLLCCVAAIYLFFNCIWENHSRLSMFFILAYMICKRKTYSHILFCQVLSLPQGCKALYETYPLSFKFNHTPSPYPKYRIKLSYVVKIIKDVIYPKCQENLWFLQWSICHLLWKSFWPHSTKVGEVLYFYVTNYVLLQL